MTDLTNYLMPPVSQEPNMLAYDDTQGMTRQRPADPLRWLADYVGQNKDLPAPQFFMDPRSLSARNMLHSALNTSANWLDGTKDPSLIGVQEMVSPTGLAGMAGVASRVGSAGSRVATAMADNARSSAPGTVVNSLGDFEIVRTPGGTGDTMYTLVPRGRSLGEADAGYFNVKPSQRNPAGIEVTNAYLEEQFRRQGLGTKIYDQIESDFGRLLYPSPTDQLSEQAKQFWQKRAPDRLSDAKPVDEVWGKFKAGIDDTLKRSQTVLDDTNATLSRWEAETAQRRAQLKADMEQAAADEAAWAARDAAWEKSQASPSLIGRMFGRSRSDPVASTPGLAANSTQQPERPVRQDDQGVMSILRRYGLAD